MDLSMILSPALEEEERSPPPTEADKTWSTDELQCAVAILQDFQQPCAESPPNAQNGTHDNDYHARYNTKHQHEGDHNVSDRAIARADDDIHMAVGQKIKVKAKPEQHQESSSTDSLSKLDLLVQADAMIDPRSSSPMDDTYKSQHLRSGVWSRAEEEYAAALVQYFLEGLLDLPESMTLRKFVADKLRCNRRRVSMKLGTGSLAGRKIPKKVGASVFVRANPRPSQEQRQHIEQVLEDLRVANFNSGSWNSGHVGDDDECHSKQQRELFKLYQDAKNEDDFRSQRNFFTHSDCKRKLAPRSVRGKPTIIRTGFESPEEEEFVTTMFECFMEGSLDLPEGTRLVHYLCQELRCTPMQLSIKLAPRRLGECKFPDNVGSIRYVRKATESASSSNSDDNQLSEELFEVESRIMELRLAHEEAQKSNSLLAQVETFVKRERKKSTTSVSSMESASGASTPSVSPMRRSFRRSGPWSHDEEVYAAALIDYFFKGVLEIAEGTTLRAFLSSRLCCNPMRISKKLASECIAEIRIPKKLGSSTYMRNAQVTTEEQLEAEENLRELQRVYMESSTGKRSGVLGSKRPRPPRLDIISVSDANATESGSKNESLLAGSMGADDKIPTKPQKAAKTHVAAKEERRQCFDVPHTGPALVLPAPLKQQIA